MEYQIQKSCTISNLAKALVGFKKDCPPIPMESTVRTNSYQFKYSDLETIDRVTKEPLTKNGLSITQLVNNPGSVTTILMHESGEFISTVSSMPVGASADKQAIGGIITYLRRYALCAILNIVGAEDTDIAGAKETAKKPATKAAAPAADAPTGLIPMTPEIMGEFEKMLKAGDVTGVQERMTKYSMTIAQRSKLNAAIHNNKQEAGGK